MIQRSTSFVLKLADTKFLAYNQVRLLSYRKFGLSSPDSDRNNLFKAGE